MSRLPVLHLVYNDCIQPDDVVCSLDLRPVIIIRRAEFPLAAFQSQEMTMIDTSRKGRRCRAKKMVRTHEAKIEPERRGTIVHELENLGRRMVLVEWDDNSSLYVFPDEIEIEES